MSNPVILPDWKPIQLIRRNHPIGQTLGFALNFKAPDGEQLSQTFADEMLASECDIKVYRNKPGPAPLGEIDYLFTGDRNGVTLHLFIGEALAAALAQEPHVNIARVMRRWTRDGIPQVRCEAEIRIYATYDSQLNEGDI